MSPTSSKRFGVLTTKDCKTSRKSLIRRMCFGVMFVLEMRAGKKLEILYVGFDDEGKKKVKGSLVVSQTPERGTAPLAAV